MAHYKIPVVSVNERGRIEDIEIWSEEKKEHESDVQIRGIEYDQAMLDQLNKAKRIAEHFFSFPFLKPMLVEDLSAKKIVVQFCQAGRYEGPSFGISFLTGCLAVVLGVPVHQDHLFTGAIEGLVGRPDGPAGWLALSPVGQLDAKLEEVYKKMKGCLFLHGANESDVICFEKRIAGFERKLTSYALLPDKLPIAALVATALNSELLIERIHTVPNGPVFALLLFSAGSALAEGRSILSGLGEMMASLRSKNAFDEPFCLDLMLEFAGRPKMDAETFIFECFVRSDAVCVNDEQRREILKAVISSDPDKPLFALPSTSAADQQQDDLDVWINALGNIQNLDQWRHSIVILRACIELAPDFEGYWRPVRKYIIDNLDALLQTSLQLFKQKQYDRAKAILTFLIEAGIINQMGRMGRGDQAGIRVIPEILEMVDRYIKSLSQIHGINSSISEDMVRLLKSIRRSFSCFDLPDSISRFQDYFPGSMVITFQMKNGEQNPLITQPIFMPRPAFGQVNDLVAYYTIPNEFSFQVDSPVLLFENCVQHTSTYCRRKHMSYADNTLFRFPINECRYMEGMFGSTNEIRFNILRDGCFESASIKWISSVNPWPPAIDSQLMAAAMLQESHINPVRLIDVGCGTGYLSVIAAHAWPSLQELHLLDINPMAVAAALENVRADHKAQSIKLDTHICNFNNFKGQAFDLLVCAPPYLPQRPIPAEGIELATNGVELLRKVVQRGGVISKEVWLSFSALAWPDFELALSQAHLEYKKIEVLRRDFVPFRISWLEPEFPESSEDVWEKWDFNRKRSYYDDRLIPRGLIDLDQNRNWLSYLKTFRPCVPSFYYDRFQSRESEAELAGKLDIVSKDSRGYRFWHEVRVVRLMA